MVEKQIIKLFCEDKELFTKYYKYVNINYIKTNYNNIYKIFNSINNYYIKYNINNNININDLDIFYNTEYMLKEQERKELKLLLEEVFNQDITNRDALIGLLDEHRHRAIAGEVALVSLDVETGKKPVQDLLELFNKFEQQEMELDVPKPIEMDLEKLYDSQVATPGLRWRVNWLNQALGSLRKGDFGFIFARPETGKTTFLA